MPLESAIELLAHARRHRYAVGDFESWDLASLEGVIEAAEQLRAVIVGFNGEFLTRPGGRRRPVGLVRSAGPRGGRIGNGPFRADVQ